MLRPAPSLSRTWVFHFWNWHVTVGDDGETTVSYVEAPKWDEQTDKLAADLVGAGWTVRFSGVGKDPSDVGSVVAGPVDIVLDADRTRSAVIIVADVDAVDVLCAEVAALSPFGAGWLVGGAGYLLNVHTLNTTPRP